MTKSDIIDVEVTVHWETEKAYLISSSGLNCEAEWVPKSRVEMEHKGGNLYEVTLPEGLAVALGIV